jgi:hypothetical protein
MGISAFASLGTVVTVPLRSFLAAASAVERRQRPTLARFP